MNYEPDEARRDLIALWEGGLPETESANLEFFLLAVLESHGLAGVRAWAEGIPPHSEATVDFAGAAPEIVRITGSGRDPVVITGSAAEDMTWVNVAVERTSAPAVVEHPGHSAFYELWDRLSTTEPPPRTGSSERAVFLVGLFEAELMNGGFGQYLTNTDGAYVPETSDVLKRIGAHRSLALLRSAVALRVGRESWVAAWDERSEEYAQLDHDFLDAAEDLAGLTASVFLSPPANPR